MGLLQKLKSTLGLGDGRSRRRQERGGDVEVTVEHEPDATPEAAVKGSDDSEVGGPAVGDDAEGEPAGETPDAESTAPVAGAGGPGEGVPVDELDGIGPAYAERLGEAEVETVTDLAGADAARVAREADISETRIDRWIEQATEY
jgi:predicted flap endonuclease-1-like 5' DNA nuclease